VAACSDSSAVIADYSYSVWADGRSFRSAMRTWTVHGLAGIACLITDRSNILQVVTLLARCSLFAVSVLSAAHSGPPR
jgi:hypothetical protein